MRGPNKQRHIQLLLAACLLSACASTESLISAPGVSLRNVQLTDVELSAQTFLLGFDVTNPNPFPLPISSVSYAVELDGYRFAIGETAGRFSVPASGDGEFAISVELNLLKTAPQLLFVARSAVRRDIPYKLKGQLGLDLPFTKSVRFESTGQVRLQARD
jgi:LEA14-like dessication related protein